MLPGGQTVVAASADKTARLWRGLEPVGSHARTMKDAKPPQSYRARRHLVSRDGWTVFATDALCGVHVLRMENLREVSERSIPAPPHERANASKLTRLGKWLLWRWHYRKGEAASELRDWAAAEWEYRAAAVACETFDLGERLDDTLDRLEFAVGMRKNKEIIESKNRAAVKPRA